MDQLDDLLAEFFNPTVAPADLAARIARAPARTPMAADVGRFHLEASDRGIRRLQYGRGHDVAEGVLGPDFGPQSPALAVLHTRRRCST